MDKRASDLIKQLEKNKEESEEDKKKFKEGLEKLQKKTKNLQKLLKETTEEGKEKGERNQAFIDELEQAIKGLMRQIVEESLQLNCTYSNHTQPAATRSASQQHTISPADASCSPVQSSPLFHIALYQSVYIQSCR
jgi:chromosome segregation ATPase